MSSEKAKYLAASGKTPTTLSAGDGLDFVVRPRFGNTVRTQKSGKQQQQQSVPLSLIFAKIGEPAAQADALGQLGIRLVSRTRLKLDLQEFQPSYAKQQQQQQQQENGRSSSTSSSACTEAELALQQQPQSIELHDTFTTRNPVPQPLGIQASYLGDAYIEADTAFCCLLETSSPYGERNSIPVLGRGSFSYLGDTVCKSACSSTAGQREHCISGATAGFLQRAALSLSVVLCLCELSKEDDKTVIEFYRRVDRTYGYGFAPYLNYLVYCCQTISQQRDSYLKYLCLEWNNSFSQDRMTQALTHFVEARRPTQAFYEEVQTVMSPEELEKDRELHHSVKGKATKAGMYIKNASRQHLACCPCHVM